MKYIQFFSLILLSNTVISAQVLIVDKRDSAYTINDQTVRSKDKSCRLINCLSRDYIEAGSFTIRPLIVVKVFDGNGTVSVPRPSAHVLTLEEYVKASVTPKLAADITADLTTLSALNTEQNIRLVDSLLLYDGRSYQLVKGGIVAVEFFNVYPFKQKDPIQTNQSLLNISANQIPINNWAKDSIPIPKVDVLLGGRMFLLRKKANDFTFFQHPFMCSDCPLTFYNEYVYRKEYGIVAFKSKYLYYNPQYNPQLLGDRILESNEYYYYR